MKIKYIIHWPKIPNTEIEVVQILSPKLEVATKMNATQILELIDLLGLMLSDAKEFSTYVQYEADFSLKKL